MQASVIIIALLATPLALLARGMACEASPVMMCCAFHGSHASHAQGMACHCGMQKNQLPDFGLLAPIAPTKTASLARLENPELTHRAFAGTAPSTASGFSSAPFEPPRA